MLLERLEVAGISMLEEEEEGMGERGIREVGKLAWRSVGVRGRRGVVVKGVKGRLGEAWGETP